MAWVKQMERLLTSSVSLSKHDPIGPDQRKQRSHKELWRQTRCQRALFMTPLGFWGQLLSADGYWKMLGVNGLRTSNATTGTCCCCGNCWWMYVFVISVQNLWCVFKKTLKECSFKGFIMWNHIYIYIRIYISVHLNKLECRGKVHLFQ